MHFGLTEEQTLLQETLRGFVANECPPARLREFFDAEQGHDPALWKGLAEMGLCGLVVPEAYGGAGLEVLDLALCCGPGIRWALMGQHLIYHLGGGEGGIEYFIDHIGKHKHRLWEDMATWTRLPEETARVLSAGIQEELGTQTIQDVERWRDKNLVELLKVINK